jgi:serine/threonine protein phosphatase 1
MCRAVSRNAPALFYFRDTHMNIHYSIGDIHGRLDLLQAAQGMIRRDAKKNGYSDCVIVYLGDYIDRGPQSAQVLSYLINSPMKGFTEIALRGNHEDMLLDCLIPGLIGQHEQREMFLTYGGIPTLMSYGNTYLKQKNNDTKNNVFSVDPNNWDWSKIEDSIPNSHIDFLESLSYKYDTGEHFYTHAGARNIGAVDDPMFQDNNVYSWIRGLERYTGSYKAMDGKHRTLVHGHCPTKDGKAFVSNHRINLDNGAVHTGSQAVGVLGEDAGPRVFYTPVFPRPPLDKSKV